MALQETLAKVHAEIDSGRLYQARDRLHGLVRSYPDNLELRWLLGDIYWRLNYPAMAGRWWWLLPPDRPEVSAAFEAYADMCGGCEDEMTARARPYPRIEKQPEGNDKERLKALYKATPRVYAKRAPRDDGSDDGCAMAGGIIALTVLLFAMVGFVATIYWLVRWVS